MHYQEIVQFWFDEIDRKQWYAKNPEFDAMLRQRFGDIHRRATQCELASWRATAQGRLAEIIILDQFSRNLGRDTGAAFASDSLALCLTQHAIAAGADHQLEPIQRSFMYMPMMHSESILIHDHAVLLFDQPGLENSLKFERLHRDIIVRFGRYPHRNAILGRESSAEELDFLAGPHSSF